MYLFIYCVWKLQVAGGGELYLTRLWADGISVEWIFVTVIFYLFIYLCIYLLCVKTAGHVTHRWLRATSDRSISKWCRHSVNFITIIYLFIKLLCVQTACLRWQRVISRRWHQHWVNFIALLLISYLFIYYVWKLQVTGGGGLCLAGLPAGGVSA